MDGLFHFSGIRRVPLEKHGRQYTLSVRQLADYGIKEQAMAARAGNPYAGIDAIQDDQKRALAVKIVADIAARPKIVTFGEESRFDNSMVGLAYNLWRALSVDHSKEFPPTVSVQQGIQLGMDFIEWYGIASINELLEAVYKAQEEDVIKNSAGPTPVEPGNQ